ncbi:MAG TPA: hypothetical protein VM095_05435 [Pyrinomonadaceae bacterium]|nr:hypothetical protein [Pyrinomonadaceae bacterium]
MKSVAFRALVLVVAAVSLLACGKKLSESERSYAETCIKINDKINSKGEANRKLCECSATIMVPKLTPGELKAYQAAPDWPIGKAMNQQELAKFTGEHGFTMEENSSLGVKRQAAFEEMRKTCGAESW